MKPRNLRIAPEPRELSLGIVAGCSASSSYRFILVVFAIRAIEYFLVANGLKCIDATMRI